MPEPTSPGPVRTQTLLQRLIAGSADAIIVLDHRERIVVFNESACRMFGYTEDEATGRLWSTLVPPSGPERRRYQQTREQAKRHGRVADVRTVRVAKEGRRVPVLLTRTVLRDETGSVLGVAIVAKDLAPLEEAERRMARSDKLAAIGELVAHLAHEVRNPLNSVVLNHEMLRSRLAMQWPAASSELHEHLSIMRDGLDALERAMNDFLRLARDAPVSPEPVALRPLCERVIRLMNREATKRGVRVKTEVRTSTPPVLGDADRIEHILMNLLRNALEASDRGGEVRVTVRPYRGRVRIRVTDGGRGMDKATRRRAFAPFFSTKPTGTGLGLAIVERMVHDMQGDLRCESRPSRGTTMSVVLPVAQEVRDDEA